MLYLPRLYLPAATRSLWRSPTQYHPPLPSATPQFQFPIPILTTPYRTNSRRITNISPQSATRGAHHEHHECIALRNPQTSLCTTSKVPVTARAVESCPCRSNIRGSRMTSLSRRPSGILRLSIIAKSKSNLSCSVTHTSQKSTDKEPA